MREVHAGERVRAEIFVAVCWTALVTQPHTGLLNWEGYDTGSILLLIPLRAGAHVLRLLLLLLSMAAEHLVEELELGEGGCEEEQQRQKGG